MVAYVALLIHEDILGGDALALGHMLWAAAHGLVMLRLSGIVRSDTELRQLHETTMSALVRGAHQTTAGSRGTGAREHVNPISGRKGARNTVNTDPKTLTLHNLLNPHERKIMHTSSLHSLHAVAFAAALTLCVWLRWRRLRRLSPPTPSSWRS